MEKNEDPYFTVRTEKTKLIRCLLYGFFLFGGTETSAGQVQDARSDSHLTGVKKESFLIGALKQSHITKAFRESKNKFAMLKKFIRSKLRAL